MSKSAWWREERECLPDQIREHIAIVENLQSSIYDRFVKLAALYDPNGATTLDKTGNDVGFVTENVVASNVDTVTASIAAASVRVRFLTDDGDWSQQRRARHLEWYVEGLCRLLDVDAKCVLAFGQGAAVRGTGIVYCGVEDDTICVEAVLPDDVIVDERECRSGQSPRQIHWRRIVDRDELVARYPGKEDEIDRAAQTAPTGRWSSWSAEQRVSEEQVAVVHSWRLGRGKRKGRHVVTIDGTTLLDEPYTEEVLPFARIVWSERVGRWYGIGLAERIAGHQRVLNKMNWQIDRLVDQYAVPTTFVTRPDAKLAVQNVNRIGTIAVVTEIPKTVIPPAVSPEVYNRVASTKASAFEETGVSRLSATAMKPAGLDSGIAMREYRDQTTQRFALQESAFEALKLAVALLLLRCCKRLKSKSPVIMRPSRFGSRKIEWDQVNLIDATVAVKASSAISRTPAGLTQTVMDLAQSGAISVEEVRRLIAHPDLEREASIYTAALENIEHCLEEIADGNTVTPEPFMNLDMAVKRGQKQYLIWRDEGAPESVLEGVRQFVVQAAELLKRTATPSLTPPPGALAPPTPALDGAPQLMQ